MQTGKQKLWGHIGNGAGANGKGVHARGAMGGARSHLCHMRGHDPVREAEGAEDPNIVLCFGGPDF